MGENSMKLLAIFVLTGSGAAIGSCVSAVLCWFDYWRLKNEKEEEIAHLKKEVRACRYLLKKRGTRDG